MANLVPATPRKERILVYGLEGSGKTHSYLSIAEKTSATFWIADSDNAFYANSEEFETVDVESHHPDIPVEWSDYVTWADKVIANASDGDWVVIDRIDHMRDAATNNYIERVYEQDAAEWYLSATKERKEALEAKKDGKSNRGGGTGSSFSAGPIISPQDWQVINGYYYSLLNRLNTRLRSQHIYLAAGAKELVTDGPFKDDRQRATYGTVGMVPEGGRRLGPIPGSILYLKTVGDARFITTVKDRGRQSEGKKLKDKRLNDFSVDYLMKVAGWKMG